MTARISLIDGEARSQTAPTDQAVRDHAQMTVPTGISTVSAGKTIPGVNVDLTWELVETVMASNQLSERTAFLMVTGKLPQPTTSSSAPDLPSVTKPERQSRLSGRVTLVESAAQFPVSISNSQCTRRCHH